MMFDPDDLLFGLFGFRSSGGGSPSAQFAAWMRQCFMQPMPPAQMMRFMPAHLHQYLQMKYIQESMGDE